MILKITIKDIVEIDLDEVMEIEEVAYPNHHWSRVSFENEISNKLATYKCALTSKGDMAGFYGFWQILEEAHITTIATHPDFRRQGVAKTLMLNISPSKSEKAILPRFRSTISSVFPQSEQEKNIIKTIMKMP